MAKAKGRILFSDDKTPLKEIKKTKGRILFADEAEPLPQEKTGFSGIGQDILNKGIETVKNIPESLMALPGEIKGAALQTKEPSRIGQNVLAGFGQLGHGILSAPGNLRDYLVKKELLSKNSPEFRLPESILPKDFEYPEAVGLNEQKPGDLLLQGVPSGLAMAPVSELLPNIPGLRSGERHQNALSKAINEIESTKKAHSEFLGHGQEHGSRAAKLLLEKIEGKINPETGKSEGGLRKKVGSQYDKLSKDMENEKVIMESSPDLKAIQKEVAKLGKGVTAKERENLTKILAKADKKKVSGSDALTAYREIKNQRNQAYKQAYTPGESISPKTREQWIHKGDQLAALEKKTKEAIGKQIGTKHLDKLKEIDKEYATTVAPLYKNPMYQEMIKHGQTSKNMMKFLHGETSGNKVLNKLVEQDPELQRLIVGQKFASNPEKILESTELLGKYKKINPKISDLIKEQEKIKTLKEQRLPKLEEAVKKARDRKLVRRGAIGTALGGAGLLGLETALGRDWKEDVPMLAALLSAKHFGKRR